MPYITARETRTRRIAGTYQPSTFVLPTDSLATRAPAAAAAIVKAACQMVREGQIPPPSLPPQGSSSQVALQRAPGLSGRYVESEWTVPPYRTLGDVTESVNRAVDWAKANPLLAAGLGVGLLLILRGGGRRR